MEVDKSSSRKEEEKKVDGSASKPTEPNRKELPINALEKYIYSRRTIDVLIKKGVKNLFPIQYETYDIIYDKYDLIAR
jgi:superfamily II DNA/RNA helicase